MERRTKRKHIAVLSATPVPDEEKYDGKPTHHEDDILPNILQRYDIIGKVGSGTFSTVYKAMHKLHGEIVALKNLTRNTPPSRWQNEVSKLSLLDGQCHVVDLYDVVFEGSKGCALVLPYFEHSHFLSYYSEMSVNSVKSYMRALFQALEHLHSNHVIHRDVKPTNFLHRPGTAEFLLVDFGLAEEESAEARRQRMNWRSYADVTTRACTDSPSKNTRNSKERQRTNGTDLHADHHGIGSVRRGQGKVDAVVGRQQLSGRHARVKKPRYPAVERSGTRGFRAPEVLLRQPVQTVALDIWSAGVILLCIMSQRYPFFEASDDQAALEELIMIFSSQRMRRAGRRCADAAVHSRLPPESVDIIGLQPKGKGSEGKEQGLQSSTKEEADLDWQRFLSNFTQKEWPEEAYDLLSKCMELDPQDRISARQALDHAFLKENQ